MITKRYHFLNSLAPFMFNLKLHVPLYVGLIHAYLTGCLNVKFVEYIYALSEGCLRKPEYVAFP